MFTHMPLFVGAAIDHFPPSVREQQARENLDDYSADDVRCVRTVISAYAHRVDAWRAPDG